MQREKMRKNKKALKKHLLFSSAFYIILMLYKPPPFYAVQRGSAAIGFILCRCVGIGRRGGLKILCQRWRVGSNPTTGTIGGYPNTGSLFFRKNLPKPLYHILAETSSHWD